MKKLICFALAVIMLAASSTAFAFADGDEISDVERWREYSAPFVADYDLNGDNSVDGLDIIFYRDYMWNEDEFNMRNKAKKIAGWLISYPGEKKDLDRNGRIGYADLYISQLMLSIVPRNDENHTEAEALSKSISNHIDKYGIEVSPAKDVSTLVFPEIVQTALANKEAPFYASGRTFLEEFRAERASNPDTGYTRTALTVTLMHEYGDPKGMRYDDPSFFPELDIAGVLDMGQYDRILRYGDDYWETGINLKIDLTLVLGDTETVESALEKLEHRHFADIFKARPAYFFTEEQDTFIEFPVSGKTPDECSDEIDAYLARYAEYAAPYLADCDLNDDGTIDAKDFEIAIQKLNHTIENDTDLNEIATIAAILLGFDEKPCDLSRDGIIGEYDIYLAKNFRLFLSHAAGDYAGPSSVDVRLAILDQGGVILSEEVPVDELSYPEYVQDALDNKKQVTGKTFSERIPEALAREEVNGYAPAWITVTPYDLEKGYEYDESYFPELDICEIRCFYGSLWIILNDTETVAGAIKKLDHRQGADLQSVHPNYSMYMLASADVGDADGDGKSNARDVVNVMKAIVSGAELTGAKKSAADVNCDGKVNARDVTLLMRKVMGYSTVTNDSPSAYCRLLGHSFTASYVTETVHNVHADSPHCEKRTYLVISCGRDGCDYIEKILTGTKRITTCHG